MNMLITLISFQIPDLKRWPWQNKIHFLVYRFLESPYQTAHLLSLGNEGNFLFNML